MNEKLKHVVQWTLYIFILIIALTLWGSVLIVMLKPSFFPEMNTSGFEDYIDVLCIALSILSAFLGVYSIRQANQSGKQTSDMLNAMEGIKHQQELIRMQQEMLLVTLKQTNASLVVKAVETGDREWVKDNVTK